ncbi:hypothetical protein SARC_00225 [Sphaeroforma arctica JP610]|uniref:Methylmalonyl-CoA epimerase, mitochondrial n=1 Tax=Sphaeroforma arctica JP610 TaxID=667725 RepID=A0A0L0GFN5_9EUKA|nr:hypothetical protein SARC_00225 [Sphaeroforma arctica JP610]KNC87654.1 hypothetical protein SARC_00225 [Sphaeroforma arctica JP610]|eukprot:XP_014161556.1 hypothetical protein SARC_00225 [Sphaeroforma arctica JP610]
MVLPMFRSLAVPHTRAIFSSARALPCSAPNQMNAVRLQSTSAKSWQTGKLNHVAIAVPDLEQASQFWRDTMGAKSVSEPVPQPEHGVYTVFVVLGDGAKIELIHPYGDKSPIANFLAKNPSGGIHHICVETDKIDNAIKELPENGIRLLAKESKIGAHGNPVVFMHPKDTNGVLTELEETKNF